MSTPSSQPAESRPAAGVDQASEPQVPRQATPEEEADAGQRVPTPRTGEEASPAAPDPRRSRPNWIFGLLRLAMGWIFFWPFLDKLFGLGYATPTDAAWIRGGSPTTGYLSGVEGPFADLFGSIAGEAWADWLFMIGLGAIGVALLLGIGMGIAALTGSVLMVLMWMASLPLTTDLFLDDHLIYALVLIALAVVRAGDTIGLGRSWSTSGLVRALPILR